MEQQMIKPPTLSFNEEKKGCGVTLTNNQQTAERTGGYCVNSVVLSWEPMEVDCLYQVKVDEAENLYNNAYIYLGVLTQEPNEVQFPRWPGHLKEAVVIYHDWVMVNGKKRRSNVGSGLSEVTQESTLGLMLDRARTLYLYKDGQRLGEVEKCLPEPCYFMVDLGYCCKKITSLPVRCMT